MKSKILPQKVPSEESIEYALQMQMHHDSLEPTFDLPRLCRLRSRGDEVAALFRHPCRQSTRSLRWVSGTWMRWPWLLVEASNGCLQLSVDSQECAYVMKIERLMDRHIKRSFTAHGSNSARIKTRPYYGVGNRSIRYRFTCTILTNEYLSMIEVA